METEFVTCNNCQGTGEIAPGVKCPDCQGAGGWNVPAEDETED